MSMQVEDDRASMGAVDGHALVVRAADDELAVALQRAHEVCGVSGASSIRGAPLCPLTSGTA